MRLLIISIIAAGLAFSCKSTKEQTYEAADPSVETRSADRGDRTKRGGKKGPPSAQEVFKMDADNDGMLSKAEADERLLKRFDVIDSNSDGYISKEEFEKAPRPQKGQRQSRNN